MSKTPWKFGRYHAGNDVYEGPIRIWDADGRVIADLPVTFAGWDNARLITEAVNGFPSEAEYHRA